MNDHDRPRTRVPQTAPMFIETTPHGEVAPGNRRHLHIREPAPNAPASFSLTTPRVDMAISTAGFSNALHIALTRHDLHPVVTTRLSISPEEIDHLIDFLIALRAARSAAPRN